MPHSEPAPRRRRTGPLAWLLIQPIRFYQRFISRYTPPTCRYYPCCSSYGIAALRTHGAAKGLLLTAWRLLRCNPWSSGGVDHVPPRGSWRTPPAGQPGREPDDAAGAAGAPVRRASDAEPPDGPGRSASEGLHNAQSGRPCAPIAGRTAA